MSWRSSPRTCASCCPRRSVRPWRRPDPRDLPGPPALRTLVLSDLHLGLRSGRDVLSSDAGAREALTAALADVDRLVLLGDILELRQGAVREVLAAAEPTLRAIGAALRTRAGAGRVTLVPGNHDHRLLTPWLERRARDHAPEPLGLEAMVDWRAGEPLARLAGWLAPRGSSVTVDAAYPGCLVRDDVYAIHGHYSDRHVSVPMFERLGAGAMARIAGESPAGPTSAEDYEAVLGPMYAWLDALAQTGGPRLGRSPAGGSASVAAWRALAGGGGRGGIRRRALAAAFPPAIGLLNRVGLGPLNADLSSGHLRRARLDAVGEVVLRLAVPARHVLFGHTHRAGPMPADAPAEWRTATGARLTNVGSWVADPAFTGGESGATSPYRPGFGAIIADGGPPELVNLLTEERARG